MFTVGVIFENLSNGNMVLKIRSQRISTDFNV